MDLLYKAQTRFLYHAHIKIKVSVFYDDDIFDELFAILEDIDTKYNSYQSGSYIDLINRNAGSFVDVDDRTVDILQRVILLSDLFDGEYDITIMPLIKLWGFYKTSDQQIPTKSDIDRVKSLIDYRRIEIDGNRVKIDKGQEIITGSFIKSFAVDTMIQKMREWNIIDAIVNAGGSTIYGINNESHPNWMVNVRDGQDDALLMKLTIADQCYSTSSQAKTFVDIDGRQYGHILSPQKGYPSTNKHIGIISDNCMIGDIVSTGLYNQTPTGFLEKMKMLSSEYSMEGFLIDENNEVIMSEGLEKYIMKK